MLHKKSLQKQPASVLVLQLSNTGDKGNMLLAKRECMHEAQGLLGTEGREKRQVWGLKAGTD